MRHLTREEQLEYYVQFLKEQLKAMKLELEKAETELSLIKNNNLVLERRKENE